MRLAIKKKILIPLVFVFAAITGGFFWWWKYYETPPEKWAEAEYSKPEDYVVIETPEGTVVENKKAGLSFKVPEGWKVEKPPGEVRDFIRLYSPGAREKSVLILESECRIVPDVQYITASIKTIENALLRDMWAPYLVSTKIIEISNREALRYVAESSELSFYRMAILVPIKNVFPLKNNKVYSFVLDSALQDKEWCLQEFEKFLETVSIE